MALTLRSTKGSPLTHAEMDANLSGLSDGSNWSATVTHSGVLVVNGNVTLGNAAGDSHNITGGLTVTQTQNSTLSRFSFINDGTGSPQTDLRIGNSGNTATLFIGVNSGSANSFLDNRSGGGLIFLGSGTEHARITTGGYLKASETGTYHNASGLTHESVQSADTQYTHLFLNKHATNPYGLAIRYNAQPNDTTHWFIECVDDSDGTPTKRAELRGNGGLANFQANDADLCDLTVKTDVTPSGSWLNFIRSIGIYEGRYKDDPTGKMHTMFVAQDIEKHDPGLITPWDRKGLKGVLEHDIMVRHIRATQELADRIDALEARV